MKISEILEHYQQELEQILCDSDLRVWSATYSEEGGQIIVEAEAIRDHYLSVNPINPLQRPAVYLALTRNGYLGLRTDRMLSAFYAERIQMGDSEATVRIFNTVGGSWLKFIINGPDIVSPHEVADYIRRVDATLRSYDSIPQSVIEVFDKYSSEWLEVHAVIEKFSGVITLMCMFFELLPERPLFIQKHQPAELPFWRREELVPPPPDPSKMRSYCTEKVIEIWQKMYHEDRGSS